MLTSKKRSSCSGQAMIEFLPAIILFFVIIAASLVFFIGLRESFHMQVAARNAMFAKIRNSGPLISNGQLGFTSHYVFPFGGATRSPVVTQANTCFTARPQSGVIEAAVPSILGLGMDLQRAHRATIFRRPGDPSACD